MSVFDEILTGFHRTGPSFCFAELAQPPDVVLIGKAMGARVIAVDHFDPAEVKPVWAGVGHNSRAAE